MKSGSNCSGSGTRWGPSCAVAAAETPCTRSPVAAPHSTAGIQSANHLICPHNKQCSAAYSESARGRGYAVGSALPGS